MNRHLGKAWTSCLIALAAFACVLAHTPAEAAPDKKPLTIVALGDSLTAGYGLPQSAAFPTVLEQALRARGHAVTIVNAGVSGDTAAAGLERLDWSVPDDADGVIVELGANDMLRGLDPARTRETIDTIVKRLQARNIPVLLVGMYAGRNLGPDYVASFDSIFPDVAKRYDVVLYPFFLEGIAGDPKLNLPEGLHPTAEGVKVIVERMLPTVESFLSRIQQR